MICRLRDGIVPDGSGYARNIGLEQSGYPEGSFLWMVNNTNFQYFSIIITLVSCL